MVQESNTIQTENSHILLYDGICNLCNGLVKFVKRREGTIKFTYMPLQSTAGQALLEKFGLPAGDLDTVVYIRGERYYLRSTAILNILKDLGGYWKLLYVFIVIPVFIRNFVYKIIAKTRYKIFGKQESCLY